VSDARAVDRGLASALRPLPRVFLQFGTLAYDTDVPEFIELSILAGGDAFLPPCQRNSSFLMSPLTRPQY